MHAKRTPSMFVAVYLLLLREERVLMLRRHQTGYEDGNYSVIAGHVVQDERVTHALVRKAADGSRHGSGSTGTGRDVHGSRVCMRDCGGTRTTMDM